MGKIFLGIGKLKTHTQLTVAYKHNNRIDHCENADPERSHLNKDLINRDETYSQVYYRRMKESPYYNYGENKNGRPPEVKALDITISVNADEVENKPLFDVNRFCKLSKEWVAETFGEQNIAGMVYHGDEHSPHIHAIVIPMTPDGRLSAREATSAKQLSEYQTGIADKLSELGLIRGGRKSVATHTEMKEFYHAVKETRAASLPDPQPGEDINMYRTRAETVFRDSKSQALAESKKQETKIAELETTIRQYELGILSKGDAYDKLAEENRRLRTYKNNTQKAMEQWNDILTAINKHLIPKEDEKQLLGLMQKCFAAAQEYNISKDEVR